MDAQNAESRSSTKPGTRSLPLPASQEGICWLCYQTDALYRGACADCRDMTAALMAHLRLHGHDFRTLAPGVLEYFCRNPLPQRPRLQSALTDEYLNRRAGAADFYRE